MCELEGPRGAGPGGTCPSLRNLSLPAGFGFSAAFPASKTGLLLFFGMFLR